MQLTAAKALAVMSLLTSTMTSPVVNVKRSIPALQGWSGKNFSVRDSFSFVAGPITTPIHPSSSFHPNLLQKGKNPLLCITQIPSR